jgi:class 3 adenylate cyclase
MSPLESERMALFHISVSEHKILEFNQCAARDFHAKKGVSIDQVCPGIDRSLLSRRIDRNRRFTQVVDATDLAGPREVNAVRINDDVILLEVSPAETLRELIAIRDGYVTRVEERNATIEKLSEDLKLFPEQNPSPLVKIGADGALVYANPAAIALEDIVSKVAGKLHLSEILKKKALVSGAQIFEFSTSKSDFRARSVWSDTSAAFIVYLIDVTAESELKTTQEEIKQFPSRNPNPVLRVGPKGKLVYANPAGQVQLRWSIGLGGEIPLDLFEMISKGDSSEFRYRVGQGWYSITSIWSPLVASYMVYFTDISSEIENKVILGNLARYFSPEVAKSIVSQTGEITVNTQRKMLTVFFSDIVGFSKMTAELEPEIITRVLFEYLTVMTEIAERWGATVDKYIGDAVMVFFGDPESRGVTEDATSCTLMALEMQESIDQIAANWRKAGISQTLQVRMGMHTGICTVGNFGSETRLDYTAVGNGVNIASRLEGVAEPNTLLCSEETAFLVQDAATLKRLGPTRLKNISHEVVVYQVSSKSVGNRSIHHEEPGFSLRLDPASVERSRIRDVLQEAIDALEE